MFTYIKVFAAAYALGGIVTYLALDVGVPDANAGWAGSGTSLLFGLFYIRRLLRKGELKMRKTMDWDDAAKEERERKTWVARGWQAYAVSFAVYAIAAQALAVLGLPSLLVLFAAIVAAIWARIRYERDAPLGDEAPGTS